MDLHLKGKTALVLAASKGLGKATAIALAREGVNVVIGARNAETLEATAEEIRNIIADGDNSGNPNGKSPNANGPRVLAVPIDVSKPEDAARIVNAAVTTFGRLDILVNNAGGPPFGPFESFDENAWQNAFDLNLASMARFCRLVIPHMKRTGTGRIINIVSLSVKTVLPGSVLSTSMRMGVIGMAKLLSNELGPDNITVNNVAPGIILTDRVKDTLPPAPEGTPMEERLAERTKEIPLRRAGQPEELAALVTFLASPTAAYITGTTIPIDGGAIRAIY